MKKILITRPMPQLVLDRASKLGDIVVRSQITPLVEQEMISALQEYEIIVPTLRDYFSAEIFLQVNRPRCKLLANFGAGYNHIDVSAAKEKGIMVTNTPGSVTDATADIAITLMLMTARRAGEGERLLRRGEWTGWHPTQLLGLHVGGKTVTVVGMGRIGKAIAHRCHFGFGMKINYASRSEKELPFPSKYFNNLQKALADADIVFLAVPGSSETRHLIDRKEFLSMQNHSILVNISRGDVIAESALIKALQQGEIGGAGLDVYEFEPEIPNALKQMENVTLFPHLGTASVELRTEMGYMALSNIEQFIMGQKPKNIV